MRIVVFSEWNQLAPFEAAWRRLHAEAGNENPFLSWEWAEAYFCVFQPFVQPLIVVGLDTTDQWRAVLPCERRRIAGSWRVGPVAADMGADDLDMLWAGPEPRQGPDIVPLVETALRHESAPFSRWRGLRADGWLARALASELMPDWVLSLQEDEQLPYAALPNSYDEFLRSKSANFRSEMRRRRRQWQARFGGPELRTIEAPAEMPPAMEVLFRLHDARRATKGGRGLFADARQRDFHHRLAPALARHGQARIYQLWAEHEPRATLYGFVGREQYFFFQSGLDPHWTEHNPGTVLMGELVADLIARKTTRFELLRGAEPYKLRWATGQRATLRATWARGWIGRSLLWAANTRRRWRRSAA